MRDYPRNDRHRIQSSPRDRNRACQICQFDQLVGLQGLRPGRNLELDPTVTASRVDVREDHPNGPLKAGDVDGDAGITAKWGVTPNVTLNAALNPDFSQVEADAAQLAVNERFALFFEEKRPFFLEGPTSSRRRSMPSSRTIADPTWGVKVTGKQKRSAGGAFFAQDEINNLIFPGYQGSGSDSIDQRVLSGVVRYRLDVGPTSNVGMLYTDREADGYHNRAGGLDAQIRLTRSDTIRFQYLLSDTEYPNTIALTHDQPSGSFSGHGLHAHYDHQSRNWFTFANYRELSPNLRADSGFVSRVDFKTWNAAHRGRSGENRELGISGGSSASPTTRRGTTPTTHTKMAPTST